MESVAVTEEGGLDGDGEDWIDDDREEASYDVTANTEVSDADDSMMDTRDLFISKIWILILHQLSKVK